MKPLDQHQLEIEQNKTSRAAKPLIREIYADFYREICQHLDLTIPGRVVEIGSGSGEFKEHVPAALCTDLFPNPWLDLACDAYHLPFRAQSVSNLVLLDVVHHLLRPMAFLTEAARVLARRGRIVLVEPYISAVSSLAYGCFHHEPVAWRAPIDLRTTPPLDQSYYAAQGNATRLFFQEPVRLPEDLELVSALARSDFRYLLSGGLSKPALYPAGWSPYLKKLDRALSAAPRLFGARCLIVLRRV